MLTVEVLITIDTSLRGTQMLRAMAAAAPEDVEVKITHSYQGQSKWLMLYGAGGDNRIGPFRKHQHNGRHVICWDLGYWDRDRALRFAIDAMHPQKHIWARPLPADRFEKLRIELRSSYSAHGPIIFAMMGRKSKAIYGTTDKVALRELRERFPDRQIIVREKPYKNPDGTAPPKIADVLSGASLVVTHHSNVAVDAIVAGVPFECVDGAAMAYRGDRLAFLRQLAWFQWDYTEAAQAWQFIRTLIER